MTEAERRWLENTVTSYKVQVLKALDALLERRIQAVPLESLSREELAAAMYRQGAVEALEALNISAVLDALEVAREEGDLGQLESVLSRVSQA